MLLRTLFVLTLLAALGETMVHAVHALAAAGLRRQAAIALHDQTDASIAAARDAIAESIAAGGDPGAVPTALPVLPRCRLATQNGCAFSASSTIAFQGAPQTSPSPCPSSACTSYEQANDAVGENRIEATIDAAVLAADGSTLAAREARATFRTMRVPPYAVPAGLLDGSTGTPPSATVGDDGGAAPSGAAPGTLIDVLYENRATGATIPANVWRAQVQRPGTTPPAWPP